MTTAAHDQTSSHKYTVHYPAHEPRTSDPHYVDFNHYHRQTGPTARCAIALLFDDQTEPQKQDEVPHRWIGTGEAIVRCDLDNPLELHHAHVEFALLNAVDLSALERDYPGISDLDAVGAWIESAANLVWLCRFHHRGHGGAHCATASDFEAERYVSSLID